MNRPPIYGLLSTAQAAGVVFSCVCPCARVTQTATVGNSGRVPAPRQAIITGLEGLPGMASTPQMETSQCVGSSRTRQ
jgi:hypothetical protein